MEKDRLKIHEAEKLKELKRNIIHSPDGKFFKSTNLSFYL